eukprot:3559582-Prymnesium_polylepis.1
MPTTDERPDAQVMLTVLTPRLARSGGTFPEACVLDVWKDRVGCLEGTVGVESFAPRSKHTL